MAPKLYGTPGSPPVRAVLMCARAIGLDIEFVNVNLFNGDHLTQDYQKKNPQHTIPLLEEEDGFILADSHAIMGYIVGKYAKDDSLYPKNDLKARSTIDHRLHFDSSILFPRSIAITKPLIFQKIKPTQQALDGFNEAIGFIEKLLVDNDIQFIAGNNITIADFSFIAVLTSFKQFIRFADFPRVADYVERVQQLPFYEANKEGLSMLKTLLSSLLESA